VAPRRKRDDLRAELRAKGLRATSSRAAVLALLRARGPMSHADAVARLAGETWDPATIYRNLMDLAEVGLARRTDVGDHVWRFEAISDAHVPTAHPHFVCTECGTIECLPRSVLAVPRARAPRALRRREVEVHVRGVCDACQ
jgi:Fur family ferric uptake transcriptional regulator